MRLADVLNGYRVVTEPTNAGAGMSQWAIAERNGEHYFLKMYLAPKYPLPNSPGSEEGKKKRREECERFERRQLEIVRRLRPDAPGGGHLVTTLEFFRVGTCYYKITRLVQTDERVALHESTRDEQSIALRSLLFSLKLLHDQGVVHGDLKPENVLFQRTAAGAVTCKLIDFDEAYISGEPPDRDRIVGDPRYYSPELFQYVKNDGAVRDQDLTTASDIFALGLLVYVLVSGALPGMPEGAAYACEAVRMGKPMKLTRSAVPETLQEILPSMMAANPTSRPTIDQVIAASRGEAVSLPSPASATATHPAPPSMRPVTPTTNAQGSAKLRSTFGRPTTPPSATPSPGSEPGPGKDLTGD